MESATWGDSRSLSRRLGKGRMGRFGKSDDTDSVAILSVWSCPMGAE
jgi:hypothetical protein